MGYSALMALNFMFCIFSVLILSFLVPYGGLTPEYLRSIDYYSSISTGEFPDKPHVAFAFGVLYFGMPIFMACLTHFYAKGILFTRKKGNNFVARKIKNAYQSRRLVLAKYKVKN